MGVAYLPYRAVFGITYFSQMHILAVFLVLGVGADDVFVLSDAWKQSAKDLRRERGKDGKPDETQDDYMTRRMQYAYSRTAKAVFNTSFTTAMAFVSTGISPLMSISTFGWFAALCILINYLFVISLPPAAIVVAEK